MALDRIRCLHCGGGIDAAVLAGAGRLSCPSCRRDGPLAPELGRAVKRHFLRLARATQRVRVALRMKQLGGMTSEPGCLGIGCVGVLVGIGVFAAGMSLLFGLISDPAPSTDADKMIDGVWFMGGTFVALLAGLAVPTFVFGWAFRRATLRAREQVLQVPLNFNARCQNCAAPVLMPIWQDADEVPCPYCDALLVPDAAMRDRLAQVRDAEGRAIGADAMAGFERALASLAGAPDRRVRDRPIAPNGKLTNSPDGVWVAQEGPVSMWTTTEMYPGMLLFSFEVNAQLPIAGTVWLLPTRDPDVHTELAPSRGFPVPDQQARSPLPSHTVWTDGDVFAGILETPRFIELIQTLGPRESLRIDPAGLSFWEIGRSGFRARNWAYGRWARKRSELTTEWVAFFC